MKEGETYKINLNRFNLKKEKIEYEGNVQKAIQIVNTEKREFVKK